MLNNKITAVKEKVAVLNDLWPVSLSKNKFMIGSSILIMIVLGAIDLRLLPQGGLLLLTALFSALKSNQ